MSQLCLHEILNGPLRDKVLDEPCALLVLCWHCNGSVVTDKRKWPVAKQLALLRRRAPDSYDLERFNWLRNPNAPRFVEEAEVNLWTERMFN